MLLRSGRVHVMDGNGTPDTLHVKVVASLSFTVMSRGGSSMLEGAEGQIV